MCHHDSHKQQRRRSACVHEMHARGEVTWVCLQSQIAGSKLLQAKLELRMVSALQVSMICKQYGVPLILDACRFAENAYFIKIREEGFRDRTVKSIAQVLCATDYDSELLLR